MRTILKRHVMFRVIYMVWIVLCIAGLSAVSTPAWAASKPSCVILLHGLARSPASMSAIEHALSKAGYSVVNQAYPSTKARVELLADRALRDARAECDDIAPHATPHVVTHSMGAILLRSFAQDHPELKWGRVVMLGPPNHGSGIIDAFGDRAAFVAANGPAALQLRSGGLPDDLPPVPFETGVIAGSQSLNPLLSSVVEGRDDGKVSIESTKVAGMKAHLTLPVTHTFMMQNPRVIVQVMTFLDTGAFEPGLSFWAASQRLARD